MKKVTAPLLVVLLTTALSLPIFADTVRLKDGSVIQGQVIGFKDQQFTVLIGSGSRGRRSRVLLYAEDVESIEFDGQAAGTQSGAGDDNNNGSTGNQTPPITQPSRPNNTSQRPTTQPPVSRPADDDDNAAQPAPRPTNNQGSPTFIPIKSFRVSGDNTTNGWTSSGFSVTRGQRIRISATGRVLLGAGRASTPAGLPTLADRDKLMKNESTGALIAVVGDDNDDFILIGRSREFVAQRDGVLFLGVNEGNLNDNTGTYEVTLEAEAR